MAFVITIEVIVINLVTVATHYLELFECYHLTLPSTIMGSIETFDIIKVIVIAKPSKIAILLKDLFMLVFLIIT